MTPRERILGIAVGSMALLGAVFYGQSYVSGSFSSRRKQIEALEVKVAAQTKLERQTQQAQAKMRSFEERSLPRQQSVARSLYQKWLLERVGAAGLTEPTVNAESSRPEKNLYVQQTFRVSGKGKLPQLVNLLHDFYSANYLHRISKLTIKPITDSKSLDVSFSVDALSLEKAPDAMTLAVLPAQQLALPSREDYVTTITSRNLFGAANQPPRLSGLGQQRAFTGKSVDISAKASDPDSLDKVTYSLIKSAVPEAKLDSSSGKFTWTPKTPGEYEFLVQAVDDGLPAKIVTEKMKVVVTDPPPPLPPEPKKLSFDDAKYTVLSGVTEVNGSGEVWLLNRPKGKTLRLSVGDTFEIGSIKGIVKEIGAADFVFESGGKQRKLSKGGILEQAASLP